MVHILTHNDLDGYSAGYIVSKHFGSENCDVTILDYTCEPAIEHFKKGDTVVITDYSLTNDQYRQILKKVGDSGHLIWCDHHKTAIERYMEDEDVCCGGLRHTGYCGAVLTYLYFETGLDMSDLDLLPTKIILDQLPIWLRYVDAWDTWKLKSRYRAGAEALNIATQGCLSLDIISQIEKNPRKFIKRGKVCLSYRDQWAKSFRDSYMFYKKMDGKLFGAEREVDVCVLTLGQANSQYFGEEVEKADVCLTQCFNGEGWKVSVYSNKIDIDCGHFCKNFGGGGHKGAAGCYFEQLYPPFSKYQKTVEI